MEPPLRRLELLWGHPVPAWARPASPRPHRCCSATLTFYTAWALPRDQKGLRSDSRKDLQRVPITTKPFLVARQRPSRMARLQLVHVRGAWHDEGPPRGAAASGRTPGARTSSARAPRARLAVARGAAGVTGPGAGRGRGVAAAGASLGLAADARRMAVGDAKADIVAQPGRQAANGDIRSPGSRHKIPY